MCAGTVVAPPAAVSAATDSITSRSRSVALRLSADLSARISTLARIGMVLRRSTTRCTWPRDFSKAARSTVSFIRNNPARTSGTTRCLRTGHRNGPGGRSTPGPEIDATRRFGQGRREPAASFYPGDLTRPDDGRRTTEDRRGQLSVVRCPSSVVRLFLQQAL